MQTELTFIRCRRGCGRARVRQIGWIWSTVPRRSVLCAPKSTVDLSWSTRGPSPVKTTNSKPICDLGAPLRRLLFACNLTVTYVYRSARTLKLLSAVGRPPAILTKPINTKPIITPHLGTTIRAVHFRRTLLHVRGLDVPVAVFFILQFLHVAFVARFGTDLSVRVLKDRGLARLVFLISDTQTHDVRFERLGCLVANGDEIVFGHEVVVHVISTTFARYDRLRWRRSRRVEGDPRENSENTRHDRDRKASPHGRYGVSTDSHILRRVRRSQLLIVIGRSFHHRAVRASKCARGTAPMQRWTGRSVGRGARWRPTGFCVSVLGFRV